MVLLSLAQPSSSESGCFLRDLPPVQAVSIAGAQHLRPSVLFPWPVTIRQLLLTERPATKRSNCIIDDDDPWFLVWLLVWSPVRFWFGFWFGFWGSFWFVDQCGFRGWFLA